MKHKVVIYESPSKCDKYPIKSFIRREIPVFIIEPFHGYHHNKGVLFFPPHIPKWAKQLIDDGMITFLHAESFKSDDIYMLAADKAVKYIELVFPEYRAEHFELISYVKNCLGSDVAENAFKNHLCNTLAEFFSVNIFLERIEKLVDADEIGVFPDTNILVYEKVIRLLKRCDIDFFESPKVKFPKQARIFSFSDNFIKNTVSTLKILFQCISSGLIPNNRKENKNQKQEYSVGITILGNRQLRGGNRGPDFLIDHVRIVPGQVVYFPLIPLTADQKDKLAQYPGQIYSLPKTGKYFSNFNEWKILLILALKHKWHESAGEITVAANVLLNYFKWNQVTKDLKIKHLITHADFGPRQIGRNLALHQAGTTTWYFTDSMNHIVNFKGADGCEMRHPFWTYLSYNHLVTWDRLMADYYKSHPGSFDQTHVVGCLWSEHIKVKDSVQNETAIIPEKLRSHYIAACFDSTFTMNGFTSYQEGISFARHLRRIVDEITDIVLLFKEKKPRDIHFILDPIRGPELVELYEELSTHPKVLTFSNQMEASILISAADMVISFPFTSTTFEALSANKYAIWHDPQENFHDTIYGRHGGVMTHGYPDLKRRIEQARKISRGNESHVQELDAAIMDPYRDKNAIDRFRTLLSSRS